MSEGLFSYDRKRAGVVFETAADDGKGLNMIYKSEASLLKEPIKEFFDIALGEYDVTEFVLLAQLAGALDVLSAQYHSLPNCEPDNESDPPDSPHEEYVRLYHRAAARFPLKFTSLKGEFSEEMPCFLQFENSGSPQELDTLLTSPHRHLIGAYPTKHSFSACIAAFFDEDY